jgi:isoleucyl-tRNA synthetase
LTDWPDVAQGGAEATCLPADPALVAAMDRVREVCSAGLAARKLNGRRVRQPLRRLVVADPDPARLGPFADLIAAEVNVKELVIVAAREAVAAEYGVATRLDVNARVAGPRLGRAVQAVIQAVKAGAWRDEAGRVIVETAAGPVELLEGEYQTKTVVEAAADTDLVAGTLPGAGFVVLDIGLDATLEAEGFARDLIRVVQDERKAAGLHVSDRIDLVLTVPAERIGAVQTHAGLIQGETLALSLTVEAGPEPAARVTKAAAPAADAVGQAAPAGPSALSGGATPSGAATPPDAATPPGGDSPAGA